MLKKNILFICSYNKNSGKGHLTRCLLLADKFEKNGFNYYFLKLKNNTDIKKVKIMNKKTASKLNNFKFTIIDNYNFKNTQIKNLKLKTRFVYFDDFGNNMFFNPYAIINGSPLIKKSKYKSKYKKVKLLVGLKYQITSIKKTYYSKNRKAMLLSFGFIDEKNLIPKFVNWLNEINFKNKIIIVVSKETKNYKKLLMLVNKNVNISLLSNLNNLSNIYKKCYLSIGAGGIMSFERIFYKIPSILVSTDKNQLKNIMYIKRKKLGYFLGNHNKINFKKFKNIFLNFIKKTNLNQISNNCKKLTIHDSSRNIFNYLMR